MYNHSDKTDHKLWITSPVDKLVCYPQVTEDKSLQLSTGIKTINQ